MIWFGRTLTVLIGAFLGYWIGGSTAMMVTYGGLFLLFLIWPSANQRVTDIFVALPYVGMVAGTLAGIVLGVRASRHFEWRGQH